MNWHKLIALSANLSKSSRMKWNDYFHIRFMYLLCTFCTPYVLTLKNLYSVISAWIYLKCDFLHEIDIEYDNWQLFSDYIQRQLYVSSVSSCIRNDSTSQIIRYHHMRDNQMINNTIAEKPCNSCLLAYLLETAPDFIQASPRHWLFEDTPSHHGRIIVAVVLLIICLPANITQILIFLSYGR